ncbi:MAG: type I restriction enzyme HsdR N-terminal domain-containing protein [Deltaproteobacteria bacterium]|nr:type I restriction enzyme HsdR N-terminal domain-containing protein [Deltaproteobacteria bacterium]
MYEKLTIAVDNILNRIDSVKGRGEEATKQAMILPMLEALGYDIWNPTEVYPEYEADVAIKKAGQKEKVDYAIVLGGKPRIFIEVKALGEPLDGHHGQLKRYFMSTTSVSLGILTNGLEYRFFTDTGEPNIQDDEAFHIAKLDSVEQGLDVMARFQRDVFSAEAIREYATELKYTSKIINFLRKEIDVQDEDLSDEFVNWILKSPGIYEGGRVTAKILERFKPITKTALQRVTKEIVRRVLREIDHKVERPVSVMPEPLQDEFDEETDAAIENSSTDISNSDEAPIRNRGILTTDEELECFAIVKRIFENSIFATQLIYSSGDRKNVPIEIAYKDTTAYFGIYFNKPSWWNMRISVDSKIKWIGFDVDPELGKQLTPDRFEILAPTAYAQFRVQIESPQDLLTLSEVVHACFEKTIKDREKLAD